MNQAKNEVFIEGILLESDIKTGTAKDSGKSFIRGEVRIQVDQVIKGEVVQSIIPVRMFAMQYTKDGEVNRAYQSICQVRDTFVSAAAAGGLEGADRVRIDKGTVNENLFVPKGSDKEVSGIEIQSNFLNKVAREKFTPLTKFETVVAVNSIKEEVRGGEPTGALVLKGGIVQYNDKLDLVDFKIYEEAGKNFIEQTYNVGDTVTISGYINFVIKTEFVNSEEQGFGEAIQTPKTTTIRELIITTGSTEPYDEDRAYERADLNKALGERLARIEELKAAKKEIAPAPTAEENLGF